MYCEIPLLIVGRAVSIGQRRRPSVCRVFSEHRSLTSWNVTPFVYTAKLDFISAFKLQRIHAIQDYSFRFVLPLPLTLF